MRLSILSIILLMTISVYGQLIPTRSSSDKYLPNTIIFKVKDQYRSYGSVNGFTHPEFQRLAVDIGVLSCKKEFPFHEKPQSGNVHGFDNSNGTQVDLSTIYRIEYSKDYKVWDVIPHLQKTNLFEYVEPFFVHRMLHTPNDDEVASQWHLATIKAYEAWDIEKGDANVVIGITDTGIELTHRDLKDNIKYNTADPIDGVDNDGDGYQDNYQGWDMVGNDNDPTTHASAHGIVVSGLAGASTNNDTMVAGTGYNCKFLPINVANSSGVIVAGYQGIVYAADHGCSVINASWGELNTYSRYGVDVVTYATVTKNALVVCAAGNQNDEGKYYPASLDWTLSVGGTDQSDGKWVASGTKGSNYNYFVDICAPSTGIHSTYTGDKTLGSRTGTSMASPIVAGAAALIRSKYPTYSSITVGELLKATADSLENIGSNATYTGKLGEGRLNMHRALTETHTSGFIMTPITFSDGVDNVFSAGDTVTLSGVIYNFLNTSSASAKATLTCTSSNVEIIDNEVTIGVLAMNAGKNISAAPFKFRVKPGVTTSEEVTFLITYTDGSNNNTKQAVDVVLNADYYTITDNLMDITVGSAGKLGYNVINKQNQGIGVEYNSAVNGRRSWLWQMGFLVANDVNTVSYFGDGDFQTNQVMQVDKSGNEADIVVVQNFNDDPAAANKLGVVVKQKVMAWKETQYQDFVIAEYKIINNSGTDYTNIHAGIYADWEIINGGANFAQYSSPTKTAYAYYNGSYLTGIHAITDSTVHHYAFDNNGANGSFVIYDGFSDAEKYSALTNGNSRAVAGGGDISHLVGVGPFNLKAGDSIVVPFAIIGASSTTVLANAVAESDTAYSEIRSLNLTPSTVAALCKDSCNGQASVVVTKGVKPYSYKWSSAGNPTTNSVNGLCDGNYTVIVTDSVGNVDSVQVAITEPSALVLGFTDTVHDVASGCIGELKATVSGGTPTYTLTWSDNPLRDSLHALNLCAGDVWLKVTDANGCVVKDTVTIDNTVSLREELSGNLKMYPNPVTKEFYIEGDLEGIGAVTLYDMTGKAVYQRSALSGLNRIVVDMSFLAQGTYQLNFQFKESSVSYPIQVLK